MDAVRFFKYDPATKKHLEYAALVVNERTVEGNDKPVLTVVHLKDDAASHAAVAGVGWEQAFERTLDVPHKSDGPEQAFYYAEISASKPDDSNAKLGKFLLENFKSHTGNEKPVDCAMRLLLMFKPK